MAMSSIQGYNYPVITVFDIAQWSTLTQHWFNVSCMLGIYYNKNAFIHIYINPCPAELFQLYFSSFEAGIANAISSFK